MIEGEEDEYQDNSRFKSVIVSTKDGDRRIDVVQINLDNSSTDPGTDGV